MHPGPFSSGLISLKTNMAGRVMARHRVKNHWFVSVEMPKQGPGTRFARQTKTFPTEADAKQFAKEMLSNKYKIVAGTLMSPHQPVRRIISGLKLCRWVEEEDAGYSN